MAFKKTETSFKKHKFLRINKIYSLCFELVCGMEISQYESFRSIFCGQASAKGLFTHDFQPFESIL